MHGKGIDSVGGRGAYLLQHVVPLFPTGVGRATAFSREERHMWYPVRNPGMLNGVRLDRGLKLQETGARLRALRKLRGTKPDHEEAQERLEKRGPRGSHKEFCPK